MLGQVARLNTVLKERWWESASVWRDPNTGHSCALPALLGVLHEDLQGTLAHLPSMLV